MIIEKYCNNLMKNLGWSCAKLMMMMMMVDWAVDTTDLRSRIMSSAMWVKTNSWGADATTCVICKPPVVGLSPALRWDLFLRSSVTRSDSNCCRETLHSVRHEDLSCASVSSWFGAILQAFRLDFSMSLYLLCCPPCERVPCSRWL